MAMAGLEAFDKTTEQTQTWVNEVARELNTDDKRQVFQGLRATLQTLRDRLTVGEAANLGAQLPILLSGFYYEGWKPERTPVVTRSKVDFLDQLCRHLRNYSQNDDAHEAERVAKAVFTVLSRRVSPGEIEDVVNILPLELRELFPQELNA